MADLKYEPLWGSLWKEILSYCSPKSQKALERSISSLERGMAPTPSFKLYGKTDISVVEKFLHSVRKEMPEWMYDYEISRLEKFGPQGGVKPWEEVKEDFDLYQLNLSPVNFVDAGVILEMRGCYAKLMCNMLSADNALQTLKEQKKIENRAAGWNTFELKKVDIVAQKEALRIIKTDMWDKGCGYTFGRYSKLKKRIFMPMSYSSMIVQAQYFIPFLSGIQNSLRLNRSRSPFTFWADKIGFKDCFEIVDELLQERRSQRKDTLFLFIQRDFEKMDTTTGTSQYKSFFIPMMDAAYHQHMDRLEKAMLFTTEAPIISPSGIMVGNHGTASGAEVTNGGETVCNDYYDRRIWKIFNTLTNTIKNFYCKLISTQGNGDDGMSIVETNNKSIFIKYYTMSATQAAQECGFKVNADKWLISDKYGLYCQNMIWIENGHIRWAYPSALILNSIMNPEHEYTKAQWDKDYRDIDITEKSDNGQGLPYFHKMLDYIMKGLKYPLLGRTEQDTKRILSKYDRYRALQYRTERFNRENYNITKSPTLLYALSKR